MIWEGTAGAPVTPVTEFDLQSRALLDEHIAERSVAYIARNAEEGKPFFTYICFTQMHPPLIHHPDFTGVSGGAVYSDTLAEVDHRSGQVLDAIDQAGVSENTIVVWCTTTRRDERRPWAAQTARGEVTLLPDLRAGCVHLPSFAGHTR